MIYCYDCRFENRATPCLGRGGQRDFDKLAAAYIEELRARQMAGARPHDSWAWECVNELEHADPRSALFFVLVALDQLTAETRHCLAALAAGPLKAILDHFGDEIVAPVEMIARASPKFRLLIGGVCNEAAIKPRIRARLRAVLARFGNGLRAPAIAPANERDAFIGTRVLDDLGGRAAVAAFIGLA
jgi:hypothetical protein